MLIRVQFGCTLTRCNLPLDFGSNCLIGWRAPGGPGGRESAMIDPPQSPAAAAPLRSFKTTKSVDMPKSNNWYQSPDLLKSQKCRRLVFSPVMRAAHTEGCPRRRQYKTTPNERRVGHKRARPCGCR